MSGIVLDTGALIALERNDRAMWTALKLAALSEARVLVPSSVLAQVWRGQPTQASLARALAYCVVSPFDPLAREVGVLCGRTGTSDIVDAHVAIVAASEGDALYTSDPKDLRRLIVAQSARRPAIVVC